MTEATIFDTGSTKPEGEAAKPNLQLPDEVMEHIGEGKKYASVEEALKSVPHAQKHIATLEQELKEMREKMEKAVSTEEVYKTVKEMLAAEGRQPAGGDAGKPIDVEALLDRKLQEREAAAKAMENVTSVKTVLAEQFGDKAADIYREKAQALGIGVEFLNDLCAKSPKAALELLGVKATTKGTAPTSVMGAIRTEGLDATKTPTKPKPVMGGASTSELMAAWRAAKPTT